SAACTGSRGVACSGAASSRGSERARTRVDFMRAPGGSGTNDFEKGALEDGRLGTRGAPVGAREHADDTAAMQQAQRVAQPLELRGDVAREHDGAAVGGARAQLLARDDRSLEVESLERLVAQQRTRPVQH